MTLLIFGKAVTMIALGGALLYILERSTTKKSESNSEERRDGAWSNPISRKAG
jgi:hypothetical protein